MGKPLGFPVFALFESLGFTHWALLPSFLAKDPQHQPWETGKQVVRDSKSPYVSAIKRVSLSLHSCDNPEVQAFFFF